MAITANSLQGFLAVYAQQSLEQLIADAPVLNRFTTNFDTSIASGGVSVTTRLPNIVWGTPNDLATNGWASTPASASSVTITLKERNYDLPFNELEFATITPTMLQNLYFPAMTKQLANGIVVDAINNVTSSVFTTTMTVNSSSQLSVIGATSSLQYASQLLTQNEVPEVGRFAYVSPAAYSGLIQGVSSTYIYGSPDALREYRGLKLIDFEPVYQYPRFYNASVPQGGSYVGQAGSGTVVTNDKLIGIAGHGQGLVAAMRAPIDVNNGLVQSATAVDKSSGISLQVRLVYDVSKPLWRLAVVSIFGTAAGNPKAIVPILTNSI